MEIIDRSRELRRKFLDENIKIHELKTDLCELDEDFSFSDFYVACRIYSEYLLNIGSLREHKGFCDKFNSFLNSDIEIKLLLTVYKDMWLFHKFNFSLEDKTLSRANKINTERALQNLFFEDFNHTTEHEIAKKEVKIGKGRCDLLIDLFGKKTAIELKNQAAKRKDVYQAFEYLVEDKRNGKADEAVLIAYSFNEDVIEIAEKLNVKLYALSWEETKEDFVDYLFLDKVNGNNEALDYILQDCNCFKLHQKDVRFREKLAEEVRSINAWFEKVLSDYISSTEKESAQL